MTLFPSLRKTMLLGAASTMLGLTGAAMAGGPDVPVAAPIAPVSGYYLEGNLGYARINYADTDLSPAAANQSGDRNIRGGFTFGFDLGYQWNQYWAVELGWYYLPHSSFLLTGDDTSGKLKLRSWAAYLALKIMIPIMMMPGASLYFKSGLAYRRINYDTSGDFANIGDGHVYKWSPMFALGMQWFFMHNWIFDLQYIRFLGGHFTNMPVELQNPVPAANLFTISLGYMFAL